jgi:hypothetical protein
MSSICNILQLGLRDPALGFLVCLVSSIVSMSNASAKQHVIVFRLAGVITHSSEIVEHPELIFVSFANRENVIAPADCGFSSQASTEPKCAARPSPAYSRQSATTR